VTAAAKLTESRYGLGNDRLPDAYSCYDLRWLVRRTDSRIGHRKTTIWRESGARVRPARVHIFPWVMVWASTYICRSCKKPACSWP